MKHVAMAFVSAILCGCATHTVHDVVTKEVQVPITTPAPLLEHCLISAPISEASYLALTLKERENALADYSITLISDLKTCNKQIDEIKAYQAKVLSAVKEANK